jgi:hypothetical protein
VITLSTLRRNLSPRNRVRSRRTFVPVAVSPLEERKVLSTVSAYAGNYSVSAFTKSYPSGDVDIYANLYSGNRLLRSNIVVANSLHVEQNPAVTINASGRFAVAYEDVLNSSDTDVKMKVFSPSGSNLYSSTVDTSKKVEYDPSVSMNGLGRIVVSYTQKYTSSDLDVKAKEYYPTNSAGSTYSTSMYTIASAGGNEFDSSVLVSPSGSWAVSYTSRFNTSDLDAKVFVHRYTGSTSKYDVATSTSNEDATAVTNYNGSSLQVSYRKNGLRYTKSLTV